MTRYNQETEAKMRLHYSRLNEVDKRLYAASESLKLGYGGQKYILALLGLSDGTIRRGVLELSNPAMLDKIPEGKMRLAGGGRKKKKTASPK